MTNCKIGFVFFLVFNVVIPRAVPLQCYQCMSYVSWKDCVENQSMKTCPSVLDSCVKLHRAFVKPNGQRTQEFHKACFHSGDCTEQSCRDTDDIVKGSWCEIECCNTTLCNTGVTPWARKHMPQTMLQVGGKGSHVTYAAANQIIVMLLIGLVFVF